MFKGLIQWYENFLSTIGLYSLLVVFSTTLTNTCNCLLWVEPQFLINNILIIWLKWLPDGYYLLIYDISIQ